MAHHECLPVPYFWGYFTTSQPVLSTLNNKIYLGHRERLPVRPLRPQPQLKPGPEPKPVKRKTAPVGGKCVVFWISCIFKKFSIYNTHARLHGLIHGLSNLVAWMSHQCSERTLIPHYSYCVLRVCIKWLKNYSIGSFV